MLKFIKNIIVFCLASSILYVLFLILWGEFIPYKKNINYNLGIGGHTFTRLNDIKKAKNIDILFLGSSHAYRGFDTRVFSETGYNSIILGTNSQTPIQSEFLLNRYLDSLKPNLVIFEVCPYVFSMDGVEASLVLLSNDMIDFELIKMTLKQNHLKIYNTLIYGLYREIFHHDKENYSENRVRKKDTYYRGGFVEKDLVFYKKENIEKQKWNYNAVQFNSFRNIVNELKKRNIDLILIQAPVTTDLYNSYKNNQDFDYEIRKYGNYFNFNERIHLNDSIHFLDYHHLNKYGVEIFNKNLLKMLDSLD